MKLRLIAMLGLSLVVACSGHSSSTKESDATAAPSALPALAFTLPLGAKVLSQHAVTTPHFIGNDILASSPEAYSALLTWLANTSAKPPVGYSADDPSHLTELKHRIKPYGIDAAAFLHQVDGKPHGLLVLVFDPATVRAKAGVVVSLASKYLAMPPMLRDPLDVQMKKHTGMTGTELLAPSNPIGAVILSLGTLKSADARGILLIDGTRQ